MKNKTMSAFLLCATVALAPAWAGVVYEIEVKDHEQSPPKTESIEAAVEGRHLKMGIASGSTGGKGDMIFRGDRREMVVVDHENRTYTVIDEETVGNLGGAVHDQMQEAMKELEKKMEGLDPKQREMMEKMLKGKMPGAAAPPARQKSELRKTSERGDQNGYPCVKYEVLRDGRKVRELWVTDWSNVEGGSDVVGAFEDMADFFSDLMDSFPDFGQGGLSGDPAFEHMREINGFPVVTREFDEDDGSLEGETTLRSARRRTLDPDAFEPPSGYKRRSMLGQ